MTHYPMIKRENKRPLRVVAILIILLIGLMASSCSKPTEQPISPTITQTSETKATVTLPITETLTLTPANTPSPIASINRTSYVFQADLDYNKHALLVHQTITYQNHTRQALTEIKLAVPPNAKQNVFGLNALSLSGDAKLTDYSLEGITLTLRLDQPLPESGVISIDLDYMLTPRLQGGILGYSTKQINFSDWYPFVPPFDEVNGWIIHQPAEVGEYLVYDNADFDLTLNLSGASGLIVAASAEAAPLDFNKYKIIQNNSRNITFTISDQFVVNTNTISGVTVRGYYFAGDEVAAQASVDYTASALQLYSEIFGLPYPHQTLSVVESDFPDGMEYDGLYYLSDFYFKNYDGTIQNYLALLSVHETSHQWWFGQVANDQALEPWLDESLATYSEYLYIEHFNPELTNWWWDYRVATYKPAGRVNLTIYDQSDLRTYINAVYLQGAVFLDQLRQTLGDEDFFTGLRTYTNTYTNKIATWEDFIKIMAPDPSGEVKTLLQNSFPSN